MLPEGINTYTGLIVVVIGLVANAFGFHIAAGMSDNLTKLIFDFIQLAGLAYAWYGRARASTPGFLVKNTPAV